MSFGSEVKKELATNELEESNIRHVVLGILLNSASIHMKTIDGKFQSYLTIKSPISHVISLVSSYLKKHYNTTDEIKTKSENNLNSYRYYYLDIFNVEKVIEDFKLINYDEELTDEYLGLNQIEDRNFFVRGLFLAHGSISNPRTSSYHFEISFNNEQLALYTKSLFNDMYIKTEIHERKKVRVDSNYILYIKKAEDISSALIYLGATGGMFNFEDQRIYRDFKNNANRVSNCDIANERKCSIACQEQLDMIEYIKQYEYFSKMTPRLQCICNLREMYPDSSIEELAEYSDNVFGKQLSKSGIMHCLRDLKQYYKSVMTLK